MLRKQRDEKPEKSPSIKPIAFGERPGPEPYNASEIVAIDDAKFLFCDNNVGDALLSCGSRLMEKWPPRSLGVRSEGLTGNRGRS